eukprot:scaffold7976_cov403-Prasinococcus_capsulatus_cf.AAC.2
MQCAVSRAPHLCTVRLAAHHGAACSGRCYFAGRVRGAAATMMQQPSLFEWKTALLDEEQGEVAACCAFAAEVGDARGHRPQDPPMIVTLVGVRETRLTSWGAALWWAGGATGSWDDGRQRCDAGVPLAGAAHLLPGARRGPSALGHQVRTGQRRGVPLAGTGGGAFHRR